MIGLSQKLSTSANYGYPFAGLPGGGNACIPSGCGHRTLAPCLRKGLGLIAYYADKYPYLIRLLRVILYIPGR
jgi:hypothetical protein